MESQNQEFKQEINVKWVRGESGSSYLCPADALARINNPTEEDYQRICVDESQNPQND